MNAALNGYFYDLYERMTAQLPLNVQTQLDELLVVPPDGAISHFESLKADAANPGVNNLEREISKLKTLLAVGVPPEAFRSIPWKVLQMLKRRAWNEKASEMREHPQGVRYALIATFVHVRLAEVTDDAVKMLVEIIQRLDRRSDQQVYRELLRDLQRVEGKIHPLPSGGSCDHQTGGHDTRGPLSCRRRGYLPSISAGVAQHRSTVSTVPPGFDAEKVCQTLSAYVAAVPGDASLSKRQPVSSYD